MKELQKIEREAERKAKDEANLRTEYRKLADSPAMADILAFVDKQHQNSMSVGATSVDSAATQSVYLQRAHAYATVKAYLRDKLS